MAFCTSCGSKKCCSNNNSGGGANAGRITPLGTLQEDGGGGGGFLAKAASLQISDKGKKGASPPQKKGRKVSMRRTITQPIAHKGKISDFISPNIPQEIENLKIETVAYHSMEKLNQYERHIRDGLMLFELTGQLPSGNTEESMREHLRDIQRELDRWGELIKDLPIQDNFRKLFHRIDGTRRLVDMNESKDVVTTIIKDPASFTDIQYLANGSYGTVYTARYVGQFVVVVKVLNGKQWFNKVQEEEFFYNEVSSMMSIQGHENILPILGALPYDDQFPPEWKVSADGNPCKPHAIVMPMMPNGTLEDLLERNKSEGKKIPLERKFQIALDICEGMTWVSSRNVLHRDLKPENVFFDKHWISKIGDVGMAQLGGERRPSGSPAASITGGSGGSNEEDAEGHLHWWTAPEIISRSKNITSKVDVYSCGFVLWQLFTDTCTNDLLYEVFSSDFTMEYHKNILEGHRPPMEDDADGLSYFSKECGTLRDHPQLREIIKEAWDADPEKRPSFEQLSINLKEAVVNVFFPSKVCPLAAGFWKKNFAGQLKILLTDLLYNIQRDFEIEEVTGRQQECMKALLCKGHHQHEESFVHIQSFSNLLKWFGSLSRSPPLLCYIEEVMQQNWFFGDISPQEAENFIRYQKDPDIGTFLVRLNLKSDPNTISESPFIITRVSDASRLSARIQLQQQQQQQQGINAPGGIPPTSTGTTQQLTGHAPTKYRIVHLRVHSEGGQLSLPFKDGHLRIQSSSIIDLIHYIKSNPSSQHLCSYPCPGSPYRKIFLLTPYEDSHIYGNEELILLGGSDVI